MRKLKAKLKIDDIINSPNIAESLNDEDLMAIAMEVRDGYQYDKESRREWERETEDAMELAGLKRRPKNSPWPKASNVKYPLITTASMQFAARTFPEIIRNGKAVECAVIGKDPDGMKEQRAKRVSAHMSYQLLVANTEFEDATDKMLHMLPIVGTVFKKTYFDPVKGRNVSELCLPDEVVINQNAKSLEEAPRITHVMCKSKNDIISNIRFGIFSDVPEEMLSTGTENLDKSRDDIEVLEQHTYIDLDDDGYAEPYVVTILKENSKVLRIVARYDPEGIEYNEKGKVVKMTPVHYFSDYHFIPSPDGTFFSLGFGHLLLGLNETINTILNQLIDAGTLANMQGGFLGRGLRIKGGQIRLRPGQWHKLDSAGVDDVRKHIVPLDYKEPSSVLFSLLGALMDGSKELTSINDALLGQEHAQNVPATTILALIEQGTKVFSSIQRRMYRSLKKEFEKLYRLNRIFLDPMEYQMIMDDEEAVFENDYEDERIDIKPVADPHMSSDAQRLARSQAQMALVGQPGINNHEIFKRYLEDLNTPNIELILPPPDPNAPPPIEVLEAMSKMESEGRKLELKALQTEIREKDTLIRAAKAEAEIEKLRAEAIKAIAEAEAAEVGQQLESYKLKVDALAQNVKVEAAKNNPEGSRGQVGQKVPEEVMNGIDGVQGLEEAPDNE